ncbi:General stress protein A [bioreactor metagenome]|uniref:General stress protein A n=1 Tax=bioreactor metagenome TaxID=1076179 RepID=A0A644UGU5_9ZZZZ|nr:glycosyltransferase family 8 protein [Methanobrevibacter sp.]MEA4957709.1 glycosyltransferase family 8 protein [Methanobrevibacter sp.]
MINIVYSSDENFVPYLSVSLISFLEHNYSDFDKIVFYILDNGILDRSKEKLKILCEDFGSELYFIATSDIENKYNIKLDLGSRDSNSYPFSAYSRLFLSTLLDVDIKKVLYLDADSLVVGSFKELWEEDISSYLCAGVLDIINPVTKIESMIIGREDDPYINTGVLLINLDKWRFDNVEKKFIDFIEKYNDFNFLHADQSVLNAVFTDKSKILILNPEFNVTLSLYELEYKNISKYVVFDYYSKNVVEKAKKNPILHHATTTFYWGRPWVLGNIKIPYYDLYKKYAEKSPFKDRIYIKGKKLSLNEKFSEFLIKRVSPSFFIFLLKKKKKLNNFIK